MPTTAWFLFLILTPAANWEQHFSQGEKLERQGLHAAAQSEFETSLASAEQLGPDDPKLPLTLHNLGTVARELGRYPESERYFQRAVYMWETNHPQRQVELAGTLQNLGALNMVWARYGRAESFYRRAYALRLTALGPTHPHVGASLHGLAELAAARHRYAEADDLYRQAEPILRAAYGPASLRMADLWHNWGFLNSELHRDAAARVLLDQAAAIYRSTLPDHPNAAIILRNLAELDLRAGNLTLARDRLERALQICEKSLPPNHQQTGMILQTYARYLEQARQKKEARLAIEKSRAILAKQQKETGEAYTIDVAALRANP
jgi:tetratricopeptide (TPR) repeat protein